MENIITLDILPHLKKEDIKMADRNEEDSHYDIEVECARLEELLKEAGAPEDVAKIFIYADGCYVYKGYKFIFPSWERLYSERPDLCEG